MQISVIATVKNEGESLRPLLDSLTYQTLLPHEIVICDGGSTDNTLAVLEEYRDYLPLKIIQAPNANISEGRNKAIAVAKGEIIAATDAGVVLAPRWVEAITREIRGGSAEIVAGWFEPDPYTDFEVVMGATVLPALHNIDPATFLPSSRSIAFKKSAWQAVGGYPEWLDYCEDLIFDFDLREKYGTFAFAPEAVAYFRPRGDMRSYAKQYYRYARGDGKADLWRKRHAIRYSTYLIGFPILLWGMLKAHWLSWALLFGAGFAYCWQPFRRLWPATRGWRFPARVWAFALVPIIRLVGDLAKMAGYPAGIFWRLRS